MQNATKQTVMKYLCSFKSYNQKPNGGRLMVHNHTYCMNIHHRERHTDLPHWVM